MSADLTFNTHSQSPTITMDATLCQITEDSVTNAVHAATYNITIEIKDKTNYEFTDGTQSKSFSWTIGRFNIADAQIIIE